MIRRYHLIDCLGRSVRPQGYTTAQGAHRAANRQQERLLWLYHNNRQDLPRDASAWTIRVEVVE